MVGLGVTLAPNSDFWLPFRLNRASFRIRDTRGMCASTFSTADHAITSCLSMPYLRKTLSQ